MSELLAAVQLGSFLRVWEEGQSSCSEGCLRLLRAAGSWAGLGSPDTMASFPSGAGEVRSACLSTPTDSTPASTSATNSRHLSPGIWLRALTGESF